MSKNIRIISPNVDKHWEIIGVCFVYYSLEVRINCVFCCLSEFLSNLLANYTLYIETAE